MLMTMMALHFWPRDRLFWLYHGGAMLFTLAITLATSILYGSWGARTVADSLAWLPLYTLAVLGFRQLFRRRCWSSLSMGRQIAVVIAYGSGAGLALAAAVQALVGPWFGEHGFALRPLVGNGLTNQLFLCAWCFIYVSVSASRGTKAAELLNLRLQNSLNEAQLRGLSNQLNPHFLFNSLNNLRFMIHENAQRADAMVIALSDILRYAIEGGKHDKVKLGAEVAIVERYLAVVAVQFEQRLRTEWDVAPTLHELLLPPMVLQTLVENAVKHGIEQLREGGCVSVQAQLQHARLLLRVSNDAPPPDSAPADGMGVGLENSRRRLQLLYGEGASLDVSRTPGRFHVLLAMPAERAA